MLPDRLQFVFWKMYETCLDILKKAFVKGLTTLIVFMCKTPNFYWLCVIASLIINNKHLRLKMKRIQRKCTVYSYSCDFIPF